MPDSSMIVGAFHRALLHQSIFVLGCLLVLAVAFNVLRTVQFRRVAAAAGQTLATDAHAGPDPDPDPEPTGRRLLRVGFGLLWILDGLLQLQAAMPLGLPRTVVRPAATTAPGWVQHVVNAGLTVWIDHPVQAAAAAVWIEIGLGLWVLVAPRGLWSRAGGLATVGWAGVVWVFGEAFGRLFSGGASWLFGSPGSALFYAAAGALVALPDRSWRSPIMGRRLVQILGASFVAMAVLQAWPGRGFWQGRTAHGPSALSLRVRSLARAPQPHLLSALVSAFGRFVTRHGGAVNFVTVLLLASIGAALLTTRRRWVLAATAGAVVTSLATWVLVQDLGFFGGVGTDPNSMIPIGLLVVASTVTMLRAAPPAAVAATATAGPSPTGGAWWQWASPASLLRTVAALAAVLVVAVGAAPMALAAANPNVDPIIDEALNGTPAVVASPAPAFHLTDQQGRPVSLASLRGHVVALTFLDPVCTSDCPLIAQDFKLTDARLGRQAGRVDFVAIVANPIYRSIAFTRAFDRQEDLDHLANWYFLTGAPAPLRRLWDHYGVLVAPVPAGSMVAHSDLAFVIDRRGRERYVLDADPGPDTTFRSSFVSLLSGEIEKLLPT